MGDDRYCHMLHAYNVPAMDMNDTSDFDFELPPEDIDFPSGLIPAYQNDEDDTIWPINNHPSYPFGNPYAPTATSVLPGVGQPSVRWNEFALEDLLPFEEGPEPPGNPAGTNDPTGADDQEQDTPTEPVETDEEELVEVEEEEE